MRQYEDKECLLRTNGFIEKQAALTVEGNEYSPPRVMSIPQGRTMRVPHLLGLRAMSIPHP